MAFVKTITTDDGQTAELHFEATMSDMKELLDSDLYKSLSEMQKLITENKADEIDVNEVIRFVKEIAKMTYCEPVEVAGVKTHMYDPAKAKIFAQTSLCDQFAWSLFDDEKASAEFIRDIMPKKLLDNIKTESAKPDALKELTAEQRAYLASLGTKKS